MQTITFISNGLVVAVEIRVLLTLAEFAVLKHMQMQAKPDVKEIHQTRIVTWSIRLVKWVNNFNLFQPEPQTRPKLYFKRNTIFKVIGSQQTKTISL